MNEILDFSGDVTLLILYGFLIYLLIMHGGKFFIEHFYPRKTDESERAWRRHADMLRAYSFLLLGTIGVFLFTPLALGEAIAASCVLYMVVYVFIPLARD